MGCKKMKDICGFKTGKTNFLQQRWGGGSCLFGVVLAFCLFSCFFSIFLHLFIASFINKTSLVTAGNRREF